MRAKRVILVAGAIACLSWELLGKVVHALLWRWFTPLMVWSVERRILGKHEGIPIVTLRRNRVGCQAFLSRTVEALKLVQRLDPVRFGRVQRQLKYILWEDLGRGSLAKYDARFGMCRVNFKLLDFERHPSATPYVYAAVLVHEATHGAIDNGEIPLSDIRRNGREYFCDAEAAGFLRHFRPEIADIWMKKYNPARALGSASEDRKHKKPLKQGGASGRQPLR